MIRFISPKNATELSRYVSSLCEQFESFLMAPALRDAYMLLHTDENSIDHDYNRRNVSRGHIIESQDIGSEDFLERVRYELYPILAELGCFNINEPIDQDYSHVMILGGALNACNRRTEGAKQWVSDSVKSVDGLTCFRPINPVERKKGVLKSLSDTEFGVMSEAMVREFGLTDEPFEDEFCGDRNLNAVSCIRRFKPKDNRSYNLFAAPSGHPDIRRADTSDTISFYMKKSGADPMDGFLAITGNRYANRQFVQLSHTYVKLGMPVDFDIIGCYQGADMDSVESYDPIQYIQDLIGTINEIKLFLKSHSPGSDFFHMAQYFRGNTCRIV